MTDIIGETDNPEFSHWPLVQELKNTQEKAIKDPLTNLLNRRGVELEARPSLGRDREFICVYFDLDHFKSINDTYGHDAGDAVIVEVARILNEETRKVDIVGRMGGEEFLINSIPRGSATSSI